METMLSTTNIPVCASRWTSVAEENIAHNKYMYLYNCTLKRIEEIKKKEHENSQKIIPHVVKQKQFLPTPFRDFKSLLFYICFIFCLYIIIYNNNFNYIYAYTITIICSCTY